nr:hypothetical protein [Tanacetum cinerariifolium]
APLSLDYVPVPEHPPVPEFVSEPVYPEFLPPEDEVFLVEEHLFPAADPEEDPTDYLAHKDDDDDEEEESSRDEADDVEGDEDEKEH